MQASLYEVIEIMFIAMMPVVWIFRLNTERIVERQCLGCTTYHLAKLQQVSRSSEHLGHFQSIMSSKVTIPCDLALS